MRPRREHATNNHQTYFVTSLTLGRRRFFHVTRWAELFLETLQGYRGRAYLLHEYVLMPEHFHLIITPTETLERAVQFVKGGFSARVKKEIGRSAVIWQRGFSDHRIRNEVDYRRHVEYILRNPVGRGLAEQAEFYPFCSAFPGRTKDEEPQWLKPPALLPAFAAGSKTPPFQSRTSPSESRTSPSESETATSESQTQPFQGKTPRFQSDTPAFPTTAADFAAQDLSSKV